MKLPSMVFQMFDNEREKRIPSAETPSLRTILHEYARLLQQAVDFKLLVEEVISIDWSTQNREERAGRDFCMLAAGRRIYLHFCVRHCCCLIHRGGPARTFCDAPGTNGLRVLCTRFYSGEFASTSSHHKNSPPSVAIIKALSSILPIYQLETWNKPPRNTLWSG